MFQPCAAAPGVKDPPRAAVTNETFTRHANPRKAAMLDNSSTVYFYGHIAGPHACFSQFYPCTFVDEDGVHYSCAEQFMMAEKARVFGDEGTRAKILAAETPQDMKALGRYVSPFREDTWAAHRERVVAHGNLLKFRQNEALCAVLLGTGGATLAEAAANDRMWGIGLDARAARAGQGWRGTNLLGKALMEVRAALCVPPAAGAAAARARLPVEDVGSASEAPRAITRRRLGGAVQHIPAAVGAKPKRKEGHEFNSV